MKVDDRRNSRRRFLVQAVPACAVTCLALKGLPTMAQATQPAGQAAAQPSGHPFDQEVPTKLTWRQLLTGQLKGQIDLAKYLTKTLGRERGIALLKAHAAEMAPEVARNWSRRAGGNDFAALKKFLSPTAWSSRLTFEVVESTETVHELKVTECLWAQACLDAGAGEEGFAAICYGDYASARAFNPSLEMVRDKTLMQGHAYCNHRYLWKG